MRRDFRGIARDLFWSVVVGAAAAWALPAWGQTPEVVYVPPEVPPPAADLQGAVAQLVSGADPLVAFLSSGFLSSAIVIAALLWLRRAMPSRYDPPGGATESSRLWNMGTALGVGVILGVATIAPAVPIPGRELVGPVLVVARVLGGFLCATAAVFGRDFYARGAGALEERRITREQAKAAGLTTGQIRALGIPEQTPGPGAEKP